jgi:hypothetical protein
MRSDDSTATSVAAVLPSCRVLLLLAGSLALAESVFLGAALFAIALLSFAISLGLAAALYRSHSLR